MFQCWLQKTSVFGYLGGYTVENTGLITYEEAVELWEKYKPEVMLQIEDGQSVEMAIWTGCPDEYSYANDTFHVDSDTVVENGEFIEVVKKVIDPSKVIMGEPV
jgi:hypothetical protein